MVDMLNLKDISQHVPGRNQVLVYWLGGAGIVFKFDDGYTICIDPYLSNAVERLYGFKRLHPAPISADKLNFDALLITHEHEDHLDIDSFEELMKNNPASKVVASASA